MASSINASTSGGGGVIVTSDATGNLDIQSGGSTVVAVTSAGVAVTGTLSATGASTFTGTGKFATTIGVGNATPSASGSGITFPATQSDSSDANTLDDYEEGTWTPSLGGNATYSVQVGRYTKIGNIVYVIFEINISSLGTGSDNTISGLPFTPANFSSGQATNFGGFGYYSNLATACYSVGIRVDANGVPVISNQTVTSNLGQITANSATNLYKNGTRVLGSVTYIAA